MHTFFDLEQLCTWWFGKIRLNWLATMTVTWLTATRIAREAANHLGSDLIVGNTLCCSFFIAHGSRHRLGKSFQHRSFLLHEMLFDHILISVFGKKNPLFATYQRVQDPTSFTGSKDYSAGWFAELLLAQVHPVWCSKILSFLSTKVVYQQRITVLVHVSYPVQSQHLMVQNCPNDFFIRGSTPMYTCPLWCSAGMASRHQVPSCCKHYLKARAPFPGPQALAQAIGDQHGITLLGDQEFFLVLRAQSTHLIPHCDCVSPSRIVLLLSLTLGFITLLSPACGHFPTNLFAVHHRRPVKSTAQCQTC